MKQLLAITFAMTLVPACDDGGDESGGEEGGGSRTDMILALSGTSAAGQTVFTANCGVASCHGADGNTPGTSSTKRLSDEIPGLSDKQIVDIVINGEGTMPPQTGLSDQQVADVLAYVQETFG
jgi:mono/diheme cytochrome c family protein